MSPTYFTTEAESETAKNKTEPNTMANTTTATTTNNEPMTTGQAKKALVSPVSNTENYTEERKAELETIGFSKKDIGVLAEIDRINYYAPHLSTILTDVFTSAERPVKLQGFIEWLKPLKGARKIVASLLGGKVVKMSEAGIAGIETVIKARFDLLTAKRAKRFEVTEIETPDVKPTLKAETEALVSYAETATVSYNKNLQKLEAEQFGDIFGLMLAIFRLVCNILADYTKNLEDEPTTSGVGTMKGSRKWTEKHAEFVRILIEYARTRGFGNEFSAKDDELAMFAGYSGRKAIQRMRTPFIRFQVNLSELTGGKGELVGMSQADTNSPLTYKLNILDLLSELAVNFVQSGKSPSVFYIQSLLDRDDVKGQFANLDESVQQTVAELTKEVKPVLELLPPFTEPTRKAAEASRESNEAEAARQAKSQAEKAEAEAKILQAKTEQAKQYRDRVKKAEEENRVDPEALCKEYAIMSGLKDQTETERAKNFLTAYESIQADLVRFFAILPMHHNPEQAQQAKAWLKAYTNAFFNTKIGFNSAEMPEPKATGDEEE